MTTHKPTMRRSAAPSALIVTALLATSCPAAAAAAEARAPNAFEQAYTAVALDTLAHALCAKISPRAETRAFFNSPGTQIYKERSRCFLYVAVNSQNPHLCRSVVEAEAWFHDGGYFSPESCRQLVSRGKPFSFTLSFDHALILEAMGYGDELERARASARPDEPIALRLYLETLKLAGGEFQRRLARLPDFSASPGGRRASPLR